MKTPKLKINPLDLRTIAQTHQILGKGYSRNSILRRIDSGEWVEGIHYIDDAPRNSRQRAIRINIAAVMDWRSTPAGKR